MLDVAKDFSEVIMESFHKGLRIKEIFIKIFTWIGTGDWDIFGKEVSPPTISGKLPIIVDREVGSMDLLRGGPQNVRRIVL